MARSAIAQLQTSRGRGADQLAQVRLGELPRAPASDRVASRSGASGSGYTRGALARRLAPAPVRRTHVAHRYCTKGGSGSVTAVFSKRSSAGRVELILSTAPAAAFRRAYPTRRRLAPGLFRASPRSTRVLGVSRGARALRRGCQPATLLRNERRLLRDLRLARALTSARAAMLPRP